MEGATDEAGYYSIANEKDLIYAEITIRAPGYATAKSYVGPTGWDLGITFLRTAGTIVGRVLDPGGGGVADATVWAIEWDAIDFSKAPDKRAAVATCLWGNSPLVHPKAWRYAVATTNAHGEFELHDVAESQMYAVAAAALNYGMTVLPEPVRPEPSRRLDVTLRLQALAKVLFRVEGDGGVPVAVRYGILRASPRPTEWARRGPGEYELSPVAPGHHVLELETEGFGKWVHAFLVDERTPAIETVHVRGGRLVSGLVVDLAGKPLEGACVNILGYDDHAEDILSTKAFTNVEGRFSTLLRTNDPVTIYVTCVGFVRTAYRDIVPPRGDWVIRLQRARDVPVLLEVPVGARLPSWRGWRWPTGRRRSMRRRAGARGSVATYSVVETEVVV